MVLEVIPIIDTSNNITYCTLHAVVCWDNLSCTAESLSLYDSNAGLNFCNSRELSTGLDFGTAAFNEASPVSVFCKHLLHYSLIGLIKS